MPAEEHICSHKVRSLTSAGSSAGGKILLAVQEDVARECLNYALRLRGYSVLLSGSQAEVLAQVSPSLDLVILDERIGEGQSWQAIAKQARRLMGPGPSLLLIADSATRSKVVEALNAGVNYIVVKRGFHLVKFFEVVAWLVQSAASRKAPSGGEVPVAAAEVRRNEPRQAEGAASGAGAARAAGQPCGKPATAERGPAAPVAARRDTPASARRTAVTREAIDRVLDRISQVKALPAVVSEVLALTGSGYSECKELVETLRQDVAMSSKVLGLANSSLYRRQRGRITSLEEAVKNIGFKAVREIALGVGIFDLFDPSQQGIVDVRRFWQHSFATASIAHYLAKHNNLDNTEEYYLTGLLHDVGKLVFDEFFRPSLKRAVQVERSEPVPGAIWERSVLGVDHARLAFEIMTRWRIPSVLTEPIGDHHAGCGILAKRSRAQADSAVLLQVADALACVFGFDTGLLDYFVQWPASMLEPLRLDDLDIESLAEAVAGQVEEMKIVMGLYSRREGKAAPPAPPKRVPVTYVVLGRPRFDMIGMWLERQEQVEVHRFEDLQNCSLQPDGRALINLWFKAPSESVAQACLMQPCTNCAIIGSRDWQDLFTSNLPVGWCVSFGAVSLAWLRSFLGLPHPNSCDSGVGDSAASAASM